MTTTSSTLLRRGGIALATFVALGAFTACGGDDEVEYFIDPIESPPRDQPPVGGSNTDLRAVVTATGTVLESPEHGPEFCQFVMESFPPQCSGLTLVGFSWDDVAEKSSENGTTWGTYAITGEYRDDAFHLTAPPAMPDAANADEPTEDDWFTTSCPEPEGGWRTGEDLPYLDDAPGVSAYTESQPDFAATWFDQLLDADEVGDMHPGINRDVVLNVTFTGDLERHEAELRKVWTGNLCVAQAPKSAAELQSIVDDLSAEFGDDPSVMALFGGISTDPVRGVVVVDVMIDAGFSERIAERFGDVPVEVRSAFQPA